MVNTVAIYDGLHTRMPYHDIKVNDDGLHTTISLSIKIGNGERELWWNETEQYPSAYFNDCQDLAGLLDYVAGEHYAPLGRILLVTL